jgi:hypothetical protein
MLIVFLFLISFFLEAYFMLITLIILIFCFSKSDLHSIFFFVHVKTFMLYRLFFMINAKTIMFMHQ